MLLLMKIYVLQIIVPNWPSTVKITMTSQFGEMKSSLNFFWRCHVFLSSLVTGLSVMSISLLAIFVYKGLTKNSKIRNTVVWVLSHIWGLGWVMDAKFGTNVFNKSLLNAAKCQDYSFYCFWVIKGKLTEKGV